MSMIDIDPTDSDNTALRETVEMIRRQETIGQKSVRLSEALGELYDMREARNWKGTATEEEKGLVGEIEGLRSDLNRLIAQVQEEQDAKVRELNEKAQAEERAKIEKRNQEAGVESEAGDASPAKLRAEVEEQMAQADYTVPESIHITDNDVHNDGSLDGTFDVGPQEHPPTTLDGAVPEEED